MESDALTIVTDPQTNFTQMAFTNDEVVPGDDVRFHLENYITDHLDELIYVSLFFKFI
jgi:hypothetical protein